MNWIRYKSGRAKTFPSTERVSELLRQRCEEHGRLEVKARPARARTRNAGNVPAAARIIPKRPRVPHLSTDHARRAGRRAAQRIALPFILSLQPANTQLPSLFSFRRRGGVGCDDKCGCAVPCPAGGTECRHAHETIARLPSRDFVRMMNYRI
jgi:hypothetical protein